MRRILDEDDELWMNEEEAPFWWSGPRGRGSTAIDGRAAFSLTVSAHWVC